MLACVGAANVLADPRRMLRSVPGALHEIGVAVTVALTVAPQLVESAQRVRRAQRLRGATTPAARRARARHVLQRVAVPVLADALERSLALAASMDARGYGRPGPGTAAARRVATACTLGGLCGLATGTYGLLDATAPAALGLPMLLGGGALAVAGLAVGGRRVPRTRYRPDPWAGPEWAVALSGAAAAGAVLALQVARPADLVVVLAPLQWPSVPVPAVAGVLLALVPLVAAPPAVAAPRAPGVDGPEVAPAPALAGLRRGPA